MGAFEKLCRVVTMLGCVVAVFIMAGIMTGKFSAPQEAAAAATAACFALVPYVFTRAVEKMGRDARVGAAERRALVEREDADAHRAHVARKLDPAAAGTGPADPKLEY